MNLCHPDLMKSLKNGHMVILGAVYDMHTGKVDVVSKTDSKGHHPMSRPVENGETSEKRDTNSFLCRQYARHMILNRPMLLETPATKHRDLQASQIAGSPMRREETYRLRFRRTSKTGRGES